MVNGQRSRLVEKVVGGVRLQGYSAAGEETVIAVPELNVCFDIGRAPPEALSMDVVCLSHGHMDHAAGLAYYFSQRGFIGNSPGTVLLDHSLVSPLKRIMSGWAEMEGHHSPGNIVGISAGDEHRVRRNLIVRAFKVNHGAGALGFSVIEQRQKLKAEFAGHSGPQLVELKKKGVTIQDDFEVPVIAYTGDTAAGNFLDEPFVNGSRVIIIECTFFDPDHLHRARQGRHLHVTDLPEILERLHNEHVVLSHVTRRTSLGKAKQVLSRMLGPKDISRICFLADRMPNQAAPSRPSE
jgi:ribonuclease Z